MKKEIEVKIGTQVPEKEIRGSEVAGEAQFAFPKELIRRRDTVGGLIESDYLFMNSREDVEDIREDRSKRYELRDNDGNLTKFIARNHKGEIIEYFDDSRRTPRDELLEKARTKDKIKFSEPHIYFEWLATMMEFSADNNLAIKYIFEKNKSKSDYLILKSIKVLDKKDQKLIVEFKEPILFGHINRMIQSGVNPLDKNQADGYFQDLLSVKKDRNRQSDHRGH